VLAAAKISSTSKLALANATVPGVSAANAWEDAQIISTTNVGQATSPKIAFDGAGNAVAVWVQNPGFDRAVYAARAGFPTSGSAPEKCSIRKSC